MKLFHWEFFSVNEIKSARAADLVTIPEAILYGKFQFFGQCLSLGWKSQNLFLYNTKTKMYIPLTV